RYIALFDGVTGEGFSPDATVDILRADQRQLVEIMKTLASEASILIFDEPTSALDRAQVDRFFQILTRLKQEGRAIVFISHRMDEIFSIGDQVTVLRDGATIGTSRVADTTAQEIVRMMVGEEPAIAAQAQTSSAASGPVALRLANLSGSGFSDIGFEVRQGEILGLGRLHGQGQSSVLRALFGAGAVTSGDVSL